jgi:hypothetical protein
MYGWLIKINRTAIARIDNAIASWVVRLTVRVLTNHLLEVNRVRGPE